MIEWSQIIGFEWDEGNSRNNVDKHGVEKAEVEGVFFAHRFFVSKDLAHSGQETTFHGLGATDAGRRLHVTFTLRQSGTLIRVISARDMSRRERGQYDKAI